MTASKPSGLWSAEPGEVLVVDDEFAARAVLSRWIEAEGFVVSGAPDAETALDILAERDIAVVTVDKDMPGHGGMWLVGEIQKRYPAVAMLLATGDDHIPPRVSMSRGVFAYLVKPFRPEAVSEAIKAGVRWHFEAMRKSS
jgi:DNA-binding NtrC family response regulator